MQKNLLEDDEEDNEINQDSRFDRFGKSTTKFKNKIGVIAKSASSSVSSKSKTAFNKVSNVANDLKSAENLKSENYFFIFRSYYFR